METIEKVKTMKTMKTINATKQELVDLINGLFQVQELKGKDFSLVVSKNISILHEALKEIEKAGAPSEEFIKLANEVNEINNNGKPNAKEVIEALEKENEKLVKARREQLDNVAELMKEEIEIDLKILSEDILPEDITAKQINNIIKIIE